jgi:hypothetical protein
MKNKILYFLILSFIINSCVIATHRTIDHSVIINKNTTFALPLEYDDHFGTVKDLRKLMTIEGLNCVSIKNAENALNNRTLLNNSDINRDIEKAFNIKDINSIYAIKLSYNYLKNLESYSYKNFTYNIVDLNSGKTIYWGKIDNSQGNYKQILKALVKKIKSKVTQ